MRKTYLSVAVAFASIVAVVVLGILPTAVAFAGFTGLGLIIRGCGVGDGNKFEWWMVIIGSSILIVASLALVELAT